MDDGTQINTTLYTDGFQYSRYVKTTRQSSGYDFNYVFNHTDHLGNIRVRYTQHPETGATEILQEDHYYPFGLKHKGYNNEHFVFSLESNDGITLVPATLTAEDGYKYKFNSREYNQDFGLNVTEMEFRQYDNALGRFMSIDALAELSQNMTPYRFGFNNPIAFNDPSGLWERLEDGSWHTDDKKDIARFMDMLSFENDISGGASIAQMDTFISEEFRGSGGRLSDGSLLLDAQVLKGNSDGSSKGFSPRQVDQISNQIARTGSHWWNEKSGDFNSMWHTYKYYRERSYYNNGGNFSGISLGAGALSYASNRLNNVQGWYSFTQGKTYSHSFYGNQYTERRAAVVKLSSFLDLTGKALTAYGAKQNIDQWRGGYLTNTGAAYLTGTDAAGLRNPTMAAWSFGTSLGKMTVESGWYYNAVHHAPNW